MHLPGFIGSSDRSQSLIANCERTMNYYIEVLPRSSKNKAALYPTPGQQVFIVTDFVNTRALFTMNDMTFAVVSNHLMTLASTGNATVIGFPMTLDENPAVITMNGPIGNQVLISSGHNAYSYDLATHVFAAELIDEATQVGMLDGYGVAFNKTNSAIRISDLNDFTAWDPTQFAFRSAAPDKWMSMVINPPDIWLIGSLSGDVWFDSGDFPFPFAPRPGANFKYGTPATFSVCVVEDSVIWLSQNTDGAGIVVQARGYTPQPVSSAAVETRIARYQRDSTIADAEAFSYQDQGHTFYVLRFPTARATEVYDLTTGLWHERGTWNSPANSYDAWHPKCHTMAFGKHLVGDAQTGRINSMDVSFGTEGDGSAVRRQRVAPAVFDQFNLVLTRTLEILLEMGLGTSYGTGISPQTFLAGGTSSGIDPQLVIEASDDGGKTYGNARQASAGKIGEYKKRLRFSRMGLSVDRVYRLTASDPIPWRIVDAYINNDGQAQVPK